ncbi:MAG: ribonuclease P protein component [Candidatus Doudnabacteria bacterium]|nr:ribonuclease P protein component [Candidatus Doudnabacteria bacterium]
MLKKVNRLAKSKEIHTAFAQGRTFFNPFFTIKFLPSAGAKKLTVVVSTKVYKNAVDRNRLKRIIRELIKKRLPGLNTGLYVIMAKSKVTKIKEVEALSSLELLLNKTK